MRANGRVIALAALLVILAAVVAYEWRQASGAALVPGAVELEGGRTSTRRPTPACEHVAGSRGAARRPAGRQDRAAAGRGTQPVPVPAEATAPAVPRAARPGRDSGGSGGAGWPPPPPPIPLKFVGIVQAPDQKLAVLADSSTKDVFYGREGDIIDGRYRILRIGVESIEMAYVDGRGRQTIRLTGS